MRYFQTPIFEGAFLRKRRRLLKNTHETQDEKWVLLKCNRFINETELKLLANDGSFLWKNPSLFTSKNIRGYESYMVLQLDGACAV